MPGLGQGERHAVPFASFFACADDATPASLLKAGIYDQPAVPLKGGLWRAAGLALLRKALLAAADGGDGRREEERWGRGVDWWPPPRSLCIGVGEEG